MLACAPFFSRVNRVHVIPQVSRGIVFCWRRRRRRWRKRGGREKLYYVPFRDLSLKPSCNDERIKGAQPLWTLADTLIHIRYTGKGKVQIKKTLSLFLSQDIAGDNIRVACPEIIFIFFRCNSGVCQLCVPSLITRFSSILMLFVDRNFYLFCLKKESKGFYLYWSIFSISIYSFEISNGNLSNLFLFFKYFLGDGRIG